MHLKGPRHERTWWPCSRHRKHLPRAQLLNARLRSRPSSRSSDGDARSGRPPRPTCIQPSSSPRAVAAVEAGASSTWRTSTLARTGPKTTSLVEAIKVCEANSSSPTSSTELKEAASAGTGTSAETGPPAAGDRDKNPRPSNNTAGSDPSTTESTGIDASGMESETVEAPDLASNSAKSISETD